MRLLRTILKREVWAVAMLLAGGGAICYGWLFHTVTVFQEEERQVEVAVPTPFGPDGLPPEQPPAAEGTDPFRSPPDEPANSAGPAVENPAAPQLPPGMTMQKVTEKYWEAHFQPEWVVIRDVTFGGITRSPEGDLHRTYTGTPPSLCPT